MIYQGRMVAILSEVFDTVLICDGCGERIVVEGSVVTAAGFAAGYECHCGEDLDAIENDLSSPMRSPSFGISESPARDDLRF